MKFLALLRVDAITAVRRLPVLAAALAVCVLSFAAAIPHELLDSGTLPKVSIAVAYSGSDRDVTDLFFGLAGEVDAVDEFYKTDMPRAMKLLEEGRVAAVIELPSDVLEKMVRGERSLVKLHARDPFVGGFVWSISKQEIGAVNSMQDAAIDYYKAAGSHISDNGEFQRANRAFDLSCINEVMRRLEYIDARRGVDAFSLQLLSFAIFLGVSVCAIFFAMASARQFSTGYIRRMKVHGVSFLAVWLSKLAIAEAISVTLCLVAAVPLKSFAGVDCHLGALAASAALMCFVLFSICMAFAVPARASAPTPSAASARALLGCVGVLLFALFAGGGFYPVYLMDASVRLFNPAWLAHILSDWILGGNGAGAAGTVTLSLLPPAACIAYSLHRARGVLK